MSTREYIGARYVPVFATPDVEWDNTRTYEPLTMVQHLGETYMSRQYVPVGAELPSVSTGSESNEFWVHMSNWNAQVESYRKEVQRYIDEVNEYDGRFDAIEADAWVTANRVADDAITTDKIASGQLDYIIRKDDKVVVFSDSTFQRNPDVSTGVYAKAVYEFLSELSGCTVDNRGIGGGSFADLLTILNGISSTAISDADYICVAYGTNDWQGSRELFPIDPSMTATLESYVKQCIEKIQQLAPNATIVMFTPAYIHSNKANPSSIMNVNDGSGTFENYCEVIEHVAGIYHVACVRLDKLLGINELNYTTKMIPSANDIWAHYSEYTNKVIAKMILSGMFLLNAASQNSYADVTPYNWKKFNKKIGFYDYNYVNGFTIGSGANGTTLQTPTIDSDDYWISFGGGSYYVYQDNELIGVSSVHTTPVCYKLKQKNTQSTLKFVRYDNGFANPIVGLKLTKGKPNIYDCIDTDSEIVESSSQTVNGFILDIYENDSQFVINIRRESKFTPTEWTPIFTMPAKYRPYGAGNAVGAAVRNGNAGIQSDSIRVQRNDGDVYINSNHSQEISLFMATVVIPKTPESANWD